MKRRREIIQPRRIFYPTDFARRTFGVTEKFLARRIHCSNSCPTSPTTLGGACISMGPDWVNRVTYITRKNFVHSVGWDPADLGNLNPGKWLDDGIINTYCRFVWATAPHPTLQRSIYLASTFDTLRGRRTRIDELSTCQVAIFPTNIGNVHWIVQVALGLKQFVQAKRQVIHVSYLDVKRHHTN